MKKKWQKVLISPNESIRSALKIINDEALRIALVIDAEGRLLGVLTDGDIRRGIINNIDLDENVSCVMNKSPITATVETSKSQLIQLMSNRSILAIPIIDSLTRKVVGLETYETSIEKPSYQNPIFIMAGGFGTRLKPLTDNCPKPMLKVGDKPILETLLTQFISSGFENIYISTHYMPDYISDYFGDGSKWGVNITYVYEAEPLGTGGALGLLPNDIGNLPLIMINGDVLTTLNVEKLLQFHIESKSIATMCVREYEYQIPYGVVRGKGNVITDMVEKPIQKFFVNAGIYVVNPEIYKNVGANTKIDMPTLLEQQIKMDKQVTMFPIHEYWLDIGRMDDFNKAQQDIQGLYL
ncbi:nucleotidyltransferase family protein [Enterobacter sp. A4]|uniref:nucleotidyltransferase family protein n=1 Tax=Enterobacter TaxID=547 RepID=UPI003D1BCF36